MQRILILLTTILLFSCNKKKDSYQEIDNSIIIANQPQEAKELMEKYCYLCHSPNADEIEGRIAPPMVAIKARYIDKEGYNKAEFIKAVSEFVANPTDDKSLMYGAVKKFGVMPKQVFPENAVAQIAAFMFDYQIEEPAWFKEHWQGHGKEDWEQSGKEHVGQVKEKSFADIGLEYALGTKKVLGENLMGTIQNKGTLEALAFCNIQAMPLTDSMSTKFNAEIKRVSDKNRNPNNSTNAQELKYIDQFKKQMVAKQEIKPVVLEKGNKVQFYYPIETNTMCLQCHGKQVKPEVAKQILKLYPKDLALGYSENEVRGIWSITFNKK
jgi:cytochrome c553